MRGRDPLVIHYVHDMERAKTFYTEALDVRPSFESPGWTTLDLGAIQLALHILHPQSEEPEARRCPTPGSTSSSTASKQVQADIERLGGRLVELREPGGGVPVRVASFVDCEGNGFELRQEP